MTDKYQNDKTADVFHQVTILMEEVGEFCDEAMEYIWRNGTDEDRKAILDYAEKLAKESLSDMELCAYRHTLNSSYGKFLPVKERENKPSLRAMIFAKTGHWIPITFETEQAIRKIIVEESEES